MYQQIGILEKDKQALSLGEINKWIELTTRASNQKDICCGRNDSALKYAISFFSLIIAEQSGGVLPPHWFAQISSLITNH